MKSPEQTANRIVNYIIDDILRRKGLADELEQIDDDIKEEMLDKWVDHTLKIIEDREKELKEYCRRNPY